MRNGEVFTIWSRGWQSLGRNFLASAGNDKKSGPRYTPRDTYVLLGPVGTYEMGAF